MELRERDRELREQDRARFEQEKRLRARELQELELRSKSPRQEEVVYERVLQNSTSEPAAYAASLEPSTIQDSSLAGRLKQMLSGPQEAWQLLAALKSAEGIAFAALTVSERARYMGGELMLSALYVLGFGWYAATHIRSLGRLGQVAGLIIPSAFAQGATPAPWSIRVVILTLYSVAVVMVLLMSSYAAMLRKPPLTSAKDIQKLALGFVTGQLTIAGFLN